ncbi:MAG TPA: hypothetical protein PLB91_04030 [Spirochaetales bacterium]|nr:hypothetical protein [Spirochaetales bacterium]HRY53470.1 hypothetical protein [Spirochaetia bacterium]
METSSASLELGRGYLLELVGAYILGKAIRQQSERALELIDALPSPAPLEAGSGGRVDTVA